MTPSPLLYTIPIRPCGNYTRLLAMRLSTPSILRTSSNRSTLGNRNIPSFSILSIRGFFSNHSTLSNHSILIIPRNLSNYNILGNLSYHRILSILGIPHILSNPSSLLKPRLPLKSTRRSLPAPGIPPLSVAQ